MLKNLSPIGRMIWQGGIRSKINKKRDYYTRMEIKNHALFRKLEFQYLGQAYHMELSPPVIAFASTHVPDEVRAKYYRDYDYSIVQADVNVSCYQEDFIKLEAIVRVQIKYEGDMVRSPQELRGKINYRLLELAQKYCLDFTRKNIFYDREIPGIFHSHPR